MPSYDDGKRYAMTLGQFIGLLVDSGHDPAVIMRVTKDEPGRDGAFIRQIEMMLIPDGQVVETCQTVGVDGVHKVLKALIEGGVVR